MELTGQFYPIVQPPLVGVKACLVNVFTQTSWQETFFLTTSKSSVVAYQLPQNIV